MAKQYPMDNLIVSMVPADFSAASVMATLVCVITTAAFFLVGRLRRSGVLRELSRAVQVLAARSPGNHGRGLSFHVTDHRVAHATLVQQSAAAAFLEHPANATPSTILSRNRHCNIFSSTYGPFWRATRRNVATGVLHPSRFCLFEETRRRVLGEVVRALESGAAPAGESLHFPMFQIIAEMCFGKDVVAGKVGVAGLHAMYKLQHDMLHALISFTPVVMYPRLGRLLYPSRFRRLVDFRRRQEESFLPLVAEVRNRKQARRGHAGDTSTSYSYVESLLDLRIQELGDDVEVTEGQIVSLISEFVGNGSNSTGAALQWTMANLVKHPQVQQKLRAEINSVAVESGVIEEADLSRMPYLRAVVLESLRRHPPLPFVMRHVEGSDAAKALGMASLPHGGATVSFLLGKMSRDPAVWSDPMSFSPERFMPGGEGECLDLTCTREIKMMPFGAGRRMCPGMSLVLLHLQYFVANLVREFEWLEDADEPVDFTEFHGAPFTRMKHPLRARLVKLAK